MLVGGKKHIHPLWGRVLLFLGGLFVVGGAIWSVLPGNPEGHVPAPVLPVLDKIACDIQMTCPPEGASFPWNVAPPEFEWHPGLEIANYAGSLVCESGQFTFKATSPRWQPGMSIWRKLTRDCRGKPFSLNVVGYDASGAARRKACITCRISNYPCDDAIMYRLVRPPFAKRKAPPTYVRQLTSFAARPVLLGRRRYCFNCHTFSDPRKSPQSMLAVQARDLLKGGTWFGVYDMGTGQGHKVCVSIDTPMSTFMAWHPDGRKLALVANQALVTLHPILHVSQDAVQPTSDIAIYDLDRKEVRLLPFASSPDRIEAYPRFSPDGKIFAFCAAPVAMDKPGKLDIYLMDFNDGRGSEPQPLPGGAGNGRSNFYPRFSPDGKWVSFVQADYGSLIKPSSDIFLYSRASGKAHKLECNVPDRADSWHSWSSNSRFLIFASKRGNGIYARLYLTEITEDGHAYPAFRLPENQTLRRTSRCRSYNIPEFIQRDPRIKERRLFNVVRSEQKPEADIKVVGEDSDAAPW